MTRYCLRERCRTLLELFSGPNIYRCPKCGTFRRIQPWEPKSDERPVEK